MCMLQLDDREAAVTDAAGSEPVNTFGRNRGRMLREVLGVISELELSLMLEVAERTLRDWRKTGEGPQFIRVGRLTYYLMADVHIWMLDRRESKTLGDA